MARAVLIDPFNQTVTEVEGEGLDFIKEQIGLTADQAIDGRGVIPGEVTMYCDDEGLYREDQKFFQLAPGMQPIGGKAIFYGQGDHGDDIDHPFIMEKIRAGVTFPDIRFADMTTEEGMVEHPLYGRLYQIAGTANFINPDGTPYIYQRPEPEGFADDDMGDGGTDAI